jgi:hypothetical protein
VSYLDRLDDEALRLRAAPFLASQPTPGLRVDVASGVAALDDVAGMRRATFKSGRKALYRNGTSRADVELLDAEELATAVAAAAGLQVPEVYRASDSELYTALPDDNLLLGIDLPDLPADELRALLDRLGAPAPADVDPGVWAQAALIDRTKAGRPLRVVDAITGTAGRHPAEWAVDGDQLTPVGFPGAWRSASAEVLDGDRSYLDSIRANVDALRPRFDRRGRGLWLDRTAASFQALGSA